MPNWLKVLAVGLIGLIGGHAQAHAASEADFFRGRTIIIAVGTSAGGSYDLYARMLARHFGTHLPGNPSVSPKNMPGGGGLVLANHLYNIAPRDGTFIAALHRGVPFEPLIGSHPESVKFDPLKMSWLGNLNVETGLTIVWHTAPQKAAEDLLDQELIVAGAGAAGDFEITANVLRNLLGMKYRIISGYPGSHEALLAMEQGEVQGLADYAWGSIRSQQANWVKDGTIRILMQIGLNKEPDLPDVPLVLDLARDQEQRKALELIFASKTIGRPFTLPQDIPPDRLKIMRLAFMATARDEKFLADARKQNLDIEATTGEAVEALLRNAFNAPKAVVERAAKAMIPAP
jgi:tripartite-type tricarboxylate transporter receptor subunit TctC